MIQLLYNLPSQVGVLIREPWAVAATTRRNTSRAGGPPAVLHYPRTVRAGTSPGLLPCQGEVLQYVHQQVRGLAEARRATARRRSSCQRKKGSKRVKVQTAVASRQRHPGPPLVRNILRKVHFPVNMIIKLFSRVVIFTSKYIHSVGFLGCWQLNDDQIIVDWVNQISRD